MQIANRLSALVSELTAALREAEAMDQEALVAMLKPALDDARRIWQERLEDLSRRSCEGS